IWKTKDFNRATLQWTPVIADLPSQANRGLTSLAIGDLAISPKNSSVVVAGINMSVSHGADGPTGPDGGLIASGGGGEAATWHDANGNAAAGTSPPGVDTSTNLKLGIHHRTVADPSIPSKALYAGVVGSDKTLQGIFRSTDDGANWQLMGIPSDADGGLN